MLLARILALLGAAAVANSLVHHYFIQYPKNSEITKRLHSGFEYGLVGTAQLPVGIFDGVYRDRTEKLSGRMRWLPWVRRLMDEFLFEENYMNATRIVPDMVIEDKRMAYLPVAKTVNEKRLNFLLFHFTTRFLETFMEFERVLASSGIKADRSERQDLLTQMYHFAYCDAMSRIDAIDKDLYNRCPNPCKSGRLYNNADKCPSGNRDCNPCVQVTEHLANPVCTQSSRIWRRSFTCNCRPGYYWDINTLSCSEEKDFFMTLRLRNKLRISIDSLNIFIDTKLPILRAGFYSKSSKGRTFKTFELNPETRFHPFGHDACSTLRIARRMRSNWMKLGGIPAADPDPIVSVDLPHPILVERVHTIYAHSYCSLGMKETDYLLNVDFLDLSTLPKMRPKECLNECLNSSTCNYVLMSHTATGGLCHCSLNSNAFSHDGKPLSAGFNVSKEGACPGAHWYTCSAYFKGCAIWPPRMVISSLPGNDVETVRREMPWQDVRLTDICINSYSKLLSAYSVHTKNLDGDFTKCLLICQRRCSNVMFLSSRACLCSSGFAFETPIAAPAPCGRLCKHRTDWWCGGVKHYKAFMLKREVPKCGGRQHYSYQCVTLGDKHKLKLGKLNESIDFIRFEGTFSSSLGNKVTLPWNHGANTSIDGYHWINPARLQTDSMPGDNYHSEIVITDKLMRVSQKDPIKCRIFCQMSCMSYFALSSVYCYCTNKVELLAEVPLKTGNCSTFPDRAVRPHSIPVGLDDNSIALHYMGEMALENCAMNKIKSKLPLDFYKVPESTSKVLGDIRLDIRTIRLKNGLGWFFLEELPPLSNNIILSTSIKSGGGGGGAVGEKCFRICEDRCAVYAYLSGENCYCSNEPPTRLKQMIRAGSYAPHRGNVYRLDYYAVHDAPGSIYYPFSWRNHLQGHAGFGSTYTVFMIKKEKQHTQYNGCYSFIGQDFEHKKTKSNFFWLTRLIGGLKLRHHDLCEYECAKSCSSPNCVFKFLICGPKTCPAPYCLCVADGEFHKITPVAGMHCLEKKDSLDEAIADLRAARVFPIIMVNPSTHEKAVPTQTQYDKDLDKFLQAGKHLAQEGGSLMLMAESRFYYAYKLFLSTNCTLRSAMPSILMPYPTTNNCFNIKGVESEHTNSHAQCIKKCRKQLKKLYTIFLVKDLTICGALALLTRKSCR
ncbi:hypothetical protein BOX15_Mlig014286g1 [Macrostomum lignano]|uniref:EGF-like domain-containing protein n=2 Tax=Macrostomum lignano TaxID=282301 RepID=A0A267ED16_9PLAT|nr:hypothetical protein BOX15_Mlig014286g1 [Macrostomum lignano]